MDEILFSQPAPQKPPYVESSFSTESRDNELETNGSRRTKDNPKKENPLKKFFIFLGFLFFFIWFFQIIASPLWLVSISVPMIIGGFIRFLNQPRPRKAGEEEIQVVQTVEPFALTAKALVVALIFAIATYILLIFPSDMDWTIRPGISLLLWQLCFLGCVIWQNSSPWTAFRGVLIAIGLASAGWFALYTTQHLAPLFLLLFVCSNIALVLFPRIPLVDIRSLFQIMGDIFLFPFSTIRNSFLLPRSGFVSSPKKPSTKVLHIMAGIGILFVLLLVIVPLLSTDAIFAYILNTYIWDPIVRLFKGLGFSAFLQIIVLSFIIIGALATQYYAQGRMINQPSSEKETENSISPIIAGIVLAGLSLVYLLFFIVQVKYLFFGTHDIVVSMNLESYARYAQKGFYELVVVCLINLGVFGVVWFGLPKADPFIKACMSALLIATLFLGFSSGWRMRQYIGSYGFTHDRIFVLFIDFILMLCGVIGVIVLYRRQFPARETVTITSLLILYIMGYANIDQWIAYANIAIHPTMKTQGLRKSESIDKHYLINLSDDALNIQHEAFLTNIITEEERLQIINKKGRSNPERPGIYHSLSSQQAQSFRKAFREEQSPSY